VPDYDLHCARRRGTLELFGPLHKQRGWGDDEGSSWVGLPAFGRLDRSEGAIEAKLLAPRSIRLFHVWRIACSGVPIRLYES
jgi:hypothetical protein